jgi:serine-type D-Ala-D-Ala endopeptidase (penicillin-binding protein 7)
MKHILLSIMLAIAAVSGVASTQAAAPSKKAVQQDPSKLKLASVNALIVDIESGKTLYAKNPETVVSIASITKLMTAMVVLDAKLPMDEILTINNEDKDTLKNSYSRVRFGSELSRREMLKLALMSSENRAASALGRHYPGGRQAFINAMNAKAKSLGMTNTRFVDTTGLSGGNVSTAQDLVKMVVASNRYTLIRDYTTSHDHIAEFRKPRYSLGFNNTNGLVRRESWNIAVSKTGYTLEAGRCLVMMTQIQGRAVAVILLDAYGKRTPIGDAVRVKSWMETGVGGSLPTAEAMHYERQKNSGSRLSTLPTKNKQG